MTTQGVNGKKVTAQAVQKKQKVQAKKKQQIDIAKAIREFADKNSAAVGKKGFSDILKMINKDNVISVIQNYDRYYNTGNEFDSESVVETILDESASSRKSITEALLGTGDGKNSVRGIFTYLIEKAISVGISQDKTSYYAKEFSKALDNEFKKPVMMRSSAKMDEIIQTLIQDIQSTSTMTAGEKAQVAATPVTTQQADAINVLVGRYNTARKNFNEQLKKDGWAGDLADGLSRIWGSKNTASKVRADLKVSKEQIADLKEARENGKAAFEAKFKEIFGVPYSAVNVAAYQKNEAIYLAASIQKGIEDNFRNQFSKLLNNKPLAEEGKVITTSVTAGTTNYQVTATKEQVYEREFKKIAKFMGARGEEILNNTMKQFNVTKLEDKYRVLQGIAKKIANELSKNTQVACGGRSYDSVEKTYNNSFRAAYGVSEQSNILKRVADYNLSQEKGAGIVKGAATAIAVIAAGMTGGTSAVVTAGFVAPAVVEVSDKATTGNAIDAAKKGGIKEYLKKVGNDVDWNSLAKASIVSGAMTIAFMGQSYAVTHLTKMATSALGMGDVAAAYTGTAARMLGGIAFPIGTEYAMTGEITVEGATFAVVLAVVGGAIEVVKISQAVKASKAEMQADTEARIQSARETLGIPDDVELNEQTLKKYYREAARKCHPDRIGGSEIDFVRVNDANQFLLERIGLGAKTSVSTAKPKAPAQSQSAENAKALSVVPQGDAVPQIKSSPSTYRTKLSTPDYTHTREKFPADAHQSHSKSGKAVAYTTNGEPDGIVYRGDDGKLYVPNKWDPEHPYQVSSGADGEPASVIMIYDEAGGDFAVGDPETIASTYKNPATGELDPLYDVPAGRDNAFEIHKDEVPSAYKLVEPGVEIQTKEGPRVVQEGDVVVYDTDGDPYVMPRKNFLKRQAPLEGDAESQDLYNQIKAAQNNGTPLPNEVYASDGNATSPSAKTYKAPVTSETPEYTQLSQKIAECTDIDVLRHELRDQIKSLSGQERQNIQKQYMLKEQELRAGLSDEAKSVQNSWLGDANKTQKAATKPERPSITFTEEDVIIDVDKNEIASPSPIYELRNMTKPDGSRRFDSDDIARLAEPYKDYPEQVRELLNMTKPDGSPRFGGYEIYRLAELYKDYPEQVRELSNMTNPDGSPRFSGFVISVLVEAYKDYPEQVRELLNMTKPDGSPRFGGDDIVSLAEPYKDYPEQVRELSNMTNPDGSPRFSGIGISEFAKAYKDYPEQVRELSNMTKPDGSPRFDGFDIARLAKVYGDKMVFAAELRNMTNPDGSPRFDSDDIARLAEPYKDYPEQVRELLNMTNPDGTPRFSGYGILKFVELYKDYPEQVRELWNMTNPDGSRRFNSDGIVSLAEPYKDYPEQVRELWNMTKPDGSPRFNGTEISDLAEPYKDYPEQVRELLNMTKPDGSPRFNGYKISELAEPYKDYPEQVRELLNMTLPDGRPRFNYFEIPKLVELYKDYPEQVRELLNMTGPDGSPRFNYFEIPKLVELYKDYPEQVRELLNMTKPGGSPRFDHFDIARLAEPYKDYPEQVRELMNMTNPGGSPRFNGTEISVLAKAYKDYPEQVRELSAMKMQDCSLGFSGGQIAQIIRVCNGNVGQIRELLGMTKPDGSPRFTGGDIARHAEIYIKYPEAVRELSNMTKPDGSPRFDCYDISDLAEPYKDYPEQVRELSNMTEPDGSPRFTGGEISDLAEIYIKYPKAVRELMNMTYPGGSPRFDWSAICGLAEIYIKYPEAVRELSAMKMQDCSLGFSGGQIAQIIRVCNGNVGQIRELLGMTNPDGSPRFTGGDIARLAEIYIKYPEAVRELSAIKKQNGSPRFSGGDIAGLAEIYNKYPELHSLAYLYKHDEPVLDSYKISELAKLYIKCPEEVLGYLHRLGTSGGDMVFFGS